MSVTATLLLVGRVQEATPGPRYGVSTVQSAKSGFPDAWLQPRPDQYVIDETLWNTQPAPVKLRNKFHHSVRWPAWHGRFYLRSTPNAPQGCIIPIACVTNLDTHDTVVFTIAGPNEPDGTRRFYFMKYPSDSSLQNLSDARLGYFPNFSSVRDFHTNWANIPLVWLEPVEGGSERMVAGSSGRIRSHLAMFRMYVRIDYSTNINIRDPGPPQKKIMNA
ncbi:hypothetical protein C8R44DRAFT_895342 [Mycena epipterygia]|nr:hypothetical protein C8R44DRAFT_895342 [Mycena epipterygia]